MLQKYPLFTSMCERITQAGIKNKTKQYARYTPLTSHLILHAKCTLIARSSKRGCNTETSLRQNGALLIWRGRSKMRQDMHLYHVTVCFHTTLDFTALVALGGGCE